MYKFDEDDLKAFITLGETGSMSEGAWYAFAEFIESLEGRVDTLLTEMVGETSDSYSVSSYGGIEAHYSSYSCGYTNNHSETIPFNMLMDDDAIKKIQAKKEEERLAGIERRKREDAARKGAATRKKNEEDRYKRFKEHEAKHGEYKNG